MMMIVRVRRPGRLAVDVAVGVVAALVTANGNWDAVARWLPHSVIVPLAVGQGIALLSRRRAPAAVLAAVTPLGVFMLAVGYPALAASVGLYVAAYALGFYGHGGNGAELSRTLQGAAAMLIAAIALAVAAMAPGARNPSGAWGPFTLGALVAACWVLGYALRMRRDYLATRRDYVAELRDRAARLEAAEGERAARAVVDERLRIARELHDVIGHSISLIAIQSQSMLGKLGVRDRLQAAVAAYDAGLVRPHGP
jgi:signal transduction histidine kinase